MPDVAGLVENGDAVKVAVRVAWERVATGHVPLDVFGKSVVSIDPRHGRIRHEHGAHDRLGSRRALGNGPADVAVDGGVDADGHPILDLVFCVNLADQTTEDILIALEDTIIIRIGKGSVELCPVVAAFHTHGVTLHVAGLKHIVRPLSVALAVILELVLRRCAGKNQIVHVLIGVHHLGQMGDVLD